MASVVRSTGSAISDGASGGFVDPLKDAVQLLVAVFKSDFGDQWSRQFEPVAGEPQTAEQLLRLWKRRCYAKLRGVDSAAIVDGYEQCVAERRPYMPNLAELTETIVTLDRRRKHNREEIAAVSVPAPRFSGGLAGYVTDVLEPNAESSVAQRELAKMRAILDRPAGMKAERDARLAANVAAHEALLRGQRELGLLLERGYDRSQFRCAVTGCQRPGTLTSSINGSAVWYCPAHFFCEQAAVGRGAVSGDRTVGGMVGAEEGSSVWRAESV